MMMRGVMKISNSVLLSDLVVRLNSSPRNGISPRRGTFVTSVRVVVSKMMVRELCEEEGIAFNLRPVAEGEVIAADELFISSAGKELLPVTQLDGEPVGHGALRGKPGPVYARLHEAYQRAKAHQSI